MNNNKNHLHAITKWPQFSDGVFSAWVKSPPIFAQVLGFQLSLSTVATCHARCPFCCFAALVQIPDAVVSAVAASSASNGRAEAFASQFSAKQPDIPIVACASYADLVGREDVDVVYIGNINTAHFETAMLAINAGKAVVVEKPVGVNGAEASALAAAAQAKGVFFMEGMWSRFLPAHRKAHELMSSGALGTIVAVHADFGFKVVCLVHIFSFFVALFLVSWVVRWIFALITPFCRKHTIISATTLQPPACLTVTWRVAACLTSGSTLLPSLQWPSVAPCPLPSR